MNRIHRAITKLRQTFTPRGLILMYHRIADPDLDPWGLSVSPDHFAEQLDVIKRYFRPMSLQDLMKRHQTGKDLNRSVIITFDDGYIDNLQNARPLLEHYEVPGTIFLVSEAIMQGRSFWWDELEWALLRPGTLSNQLEFSINGSRYEWELGTAARYGPEDRREDRKRRPWDAQAGTRLAFYYSVWQRLILLPHPQRLEVMDAIREWSGLGNESRVEDRALTPREVNLLGQGELIELGAHTVTHASLTTLSVERQWEELWQSKAQLEEIINRPVRSFSYPHGDYSLETVSLVQKAGFHSACTTEFRCVIPGSNPFRFPRFQVEDWNGEEFLRWLARWYAFS